MPEVVVYSSDWCPYCRRAKALLTSKHIDFQEICVDGQDALRAEMVALAGQTSVPQIWINGQHIGGCDDLHLLEKRGELDTMLARNP